MSNNQQEKREATAHAYASFFQNLSADKHNGLSEILSADVHFTDPFNDTKGLGNVIAILEKMHKDVENPRFMILDIIWSGDICFMRWDFSCFQPTLGIWKFRGMTELHFNQEGLISSHFDYWDSGKHFYAKLPFLGRIIRAIIRKASISKT
ncbi:nuclear transport factor 2 family protein [Cohaesibacter celericrescens]|uniref:Nuclear transport factor 2 family protein n=1 Tax=Cohaesibacter celericrescens TaxID=2067669 RepID=A0A2N5XPA8_9HYPH|nr:nuclear transport factor 2 family protein [Cohaesibacter celericrescens]PLW76315.1 nuclear transport factor 2 family protein [Cohaesibacter celericrescens]